MVSCSGDHNALEDINSWLSGSTRFDLSLATEYFKAEYYFIWKYMDSCEEFLRGEK